MADLVVLGFNDKANAERAFALITDELPKQQLLQIGDAALVWRDEKGKPKIEQAVNTTAAGAVNGAFWGGLVGLLFLSPLFGLAVGATAGAIGGKLTDVGINDAMIKKLAKQLEPGKAAVFTLVRSATKDRVVQALLPYSPEVLQTSLPFEDQEALVKAFQA